MTGTFRERRRRLGIGGLALALLLGFVPLLTASPASADSPTTHTVVASTATQTNVSRPGPLTGLTDGSVVTITVTQASASDPISGITQVRQCEGGAPITNAGDMGPSNTGYCIASQPFGQSDVVKTDINKANSTDNFITFTFKVGEGSQAVQFDNGAGTQTNTITCDGTHDCSLWLGIARTGGTDFVHYDLQFLGTPGAPTLGAPSCNATGASVTLTAAANTGHSPIVSYTLSATPTDGGAAVSPVTVPATGAAPGYTGTGTLTGFTQFKHYDLTGTATNAGGLTSAASAATTGVQSCPPGPVLAQATVAPHAATFNWTYGDSANATGYEVLIRDHSTGDSTTTITVTGGNVLTANATGLNTGDDYFAKVRATYGGGNFSAYSNEVEFAPPPDAILTQTIHVRRPEGALVITQVCGATAANGGVGTAPTTPGPGGTPDPQFSQYPYPVDANGVAAPTYPTDCGIQLGTAHLITSGAGKGQFWSATGNLNEVTVVDTRDTDPGWTVNGRMGTFTAAPGLTFSGDELGWVPASSDTPQATFSDGSTYDQTVTPGGTVAPNTLTSSGLGLGALPNGQVLGTAASGKGLGIATLDAALTLWIPINARTGDYTGTLTITAV